MGIFFELLRNTDEDKSNAGAYFISRICNVEDHDVSEVIDALITKIRDEYFSSLVGLEAVLSSMKNDIEKNKFLELGGINCLQEIISSTAEIDIPRKIYAILIRIELSSKVPLSNSDLSDLSSLCSRTDEQLTEILEENIVRIHYTHITPLIKSTNQTYQKLGLWISVYCAISGVQHITGDLKTLLDKFKNSYDQNFIDKAETLLE